MTSDSDSGSDPLTDLGRRAGTHINKIGTIGGLAVMLIGTVMLAPDSRQVGPHVGGWSHAQTYLLFVIALTLILLLAAVYRLQVILSSSGEH